MDSEAVRFAYHCWRRDLSNFSLLKYRHCDGHLVSMHQSGTHWLKFMLATALAEDYGVPGPRYNHANDIIGGPKDVRRYPQLPYLLSSHSIPHLALRWRWVRDRFRLPKYVVLVRDIRDSLVSNYEKWKDVYGVSFSEYLRGDSSGRRYNNDIWWCIRFLNAWGTIFDRFPDCTLLIRYEDLEKDAAGELGKLNGFWSLELSDTVIRSATEVSGKEQMASRHDPGRPQGAIRQDHRPSTAWFDEQDHAFVAAVLARYLRWSFGYRYHGHSGVP